MNLPLPSSMHRRCWGLVGGLVLLLMGVGFLAGAASFLFCLLVLVPPLLSVPRWCRFHSGRGCLPGWRNAFWAIVVVCLALAFLVFCHIRFALPALEAARIQSWPQVEGRVLSYEHERVKGASSRRSRSGYTRYRAEVAFEWQGHAYLTRELGTRFKQMSGMYQRGARVPVWVNEAEPQASALSCGVYWFDWGLLFGLGNLLFCIAPWVAFRECE